MEKGNVASKVPGKGEAEAIRVYKTLKNLGVALTKDTAFPPSPGTLSSAGVGPWRIVQRRSQFTYLVGQPLGSPSQKSVCHCHRYTLSKCITRRLLRGLAHPLNSPSPVPLGANMRELLVLKCSL